jgi:hypothetical protein
MRGLVVQINSPPNKSYLCSFMLHQHPYFFHARSADRTTIDHQGQVLPNIDAACHEAVKAAEQLWEALSGLVLDDMALEVTDESGQRVLTVFLKEVGTRRSATLH